MNHIPSGDFQGWSCDGLPEHSTAFLSASVAAPVIFFSPSPLPSLWSRAGRLQRLPDGERRRSTVGQVVSAAPLVFLDTRPSISPAMDQVDGALGG